jgi:hypothetical protein
MAMQKLDEISMRTIASKNLEELSLEALLEKAPASMEFAHIP